MNPWTIFDIHESIRSLEKILASDIFEEHNHAHPWQSAAFTQLLVLLRDLMSKAETYSTRVSFTDDVLITPQVRDVTDLITTFRDAACHLDSQKRFFSPGKVKLPRGIIYGNKGFAVPSDSSPSGWTYLYGKYEDDVCFLCGPHRLYLKRHVIRALEEAKQKLAPLIAPYVPPST